MRILHLAPLLAAIPSTLAIPEVPVINATGVPTNYGILLFPGFQALDVFGPLDVLNNIFMIFNETMNLSVISKTLDPVTTVPGMKRNLTWRFGEEIMPTHTIQNVLANQATYPEINGVSNTSDIEVLIVPGGTGTRGDMSAEIGLVKALYPKLKYLISVCTGASILAQAGVLDGRNATSNKKAFTWVKSTGPKVNWVPSARWVADGNVWTSSGVSAGIDVTYAWVSEVYGDEVAQYAADMAEYERMTDSTNDPFSKVWNATA